MEVREKLVELLGANTCTHDCCEDCEYREDRDACIDYLKNSMADYLIAHGITVQECGEWVYDHWCEFKCSVCGQFSNSKPYKGKENYCPHCGAKMMPQPPKGE